MGFSRSVLVELRIETHESLAKGGENMVENDETTGRVGVIEARATGVGIGFSDSHRPNARDSYSWIVGFDRKKD